MPACRYVEENGSTAMLAAKRSGVTPEPLAEVNLKEHVTCMPPPSINNAVHSGFETLRRHHQKSKAAVLEAPQEKETHVLQKFLKKDVVQEI